MQHELQCFFSFVDGLPDIKTKLDSRSQPPNDKILACHI